MQRCCNSSIVWVLLARWFFTRMVEFSWLTRKSFTYSSRQLVGSSFQWIGYDKIYVYIILYSITEVYLYIYFIPYYPVWNLALLTGRMFWVYTGPAQWYPFLYLLQFRLFIFSNFWTIYCIQATKYESSTQTRAL